MDSSLLTSDSGTLLVRDNAIIFSIDHVRLIVTADKALIPREGFEHNPLSNRCAWIAAAAAGKALAPAEGWRAQPAPPCRFVEYLEEVVSEWARQQAEPHDSSRQDSDATQAARVAAHFDRGAVPGAQSSVRIAPFEHYLCVPCLLPRLSLPLRPRPDLCVAARLPEPLCPAC